ncbi:MAG: choice-of-anchor B family protein [Ignavibacteriaceae bacterium]|jgi:choice-of-anchor B domain-containing protein|nr:choice-of-anchor B family protein [Ignavibacteriaceae bacterium]MCU0405812.1 choice-of-anchor B family protein [Ignavibacteriaceae bacterium]MCU0412974.1 choice-of-anchor B family protein [Ignavibacteriaceae bacterium]
MKKFLAVVFHLLAFSYAVSNGQNVTLLGTLNPYPGAAYANIWGYAASGREYAIMGVTGGTTIIDVTNPSTPVEVAFIPGPLAPPYEWREIKTHSHYAYVVSEGTGSGAGMQIIDLSNLPTGASLAATYTATFTRAHEIFIADGYAYVVGTSQGGMHILDLSNPTSPLQVGYYGASGYVHDVHVWNDTAYVSSADTYDLVSVSNKSNPQLISQSAALPGIYAHSGWLTDDKRYFIACEEFNVIDLTVWDLQDRTTWDLVVPSWQMAGPSPIHNIFILGDYAHISYYKDGYVVLDISDPTNPQFAGQYDTYPGSGGGTYNGAWGVDPYLPSGNTIVSDMSTGLYICRFEPPVSSVEENQDVSLDFSLAQNFPNPFNPNTRIKFTIKNPGFVTLKVYNGIGQEIIALVSEEKTEGTYEVNFNALGIPSGIYFAKLSSGNQTQIIKMSLLK